MGDTGFLSQYKAVAGTKRVWVADENGDEVLMDISELLNSSASVFGKVWFVDAVNGNNNNDGLSAQSAFKTIQQAVNSVSPNTDAIIVFGSSDEQVTITRATGALTIIGAGGLGNSGIASTAVGEVGLNYNNDGLTLINFGVSAETTAPFSMTGTGSRLRIYACKIEGVDTAGGIALGFGPGSVADIGLNRTGNAGDIEIINCEFAWSDNAIGLIASDYGVPTQVKIKDCEFNNISTKHILGVPASFGVGSVRNLVMKNCDFDNMEDGTAPSKFVELNTAFDTGIIAGNNFAIATNAIAKFDIGAGLLWVANNTEAGASVARPA